MKLESDTAVIVVPWDLSDSFRPAIDRAFELVADNGCIHVIHVIRPSAEDGYGVIWDTFRQNQIAMTRVREAFQREVALDPRLNQVSLSVRFGEPGPTINQFAEQVEAGLIVLPPARRSMLRRLLSVPLAESIMRSAPCAVLVVQEESCRPATTNRLFNKILSVARNTRDPSVPSLAD